MPQHDHGVTVAPTAQRTWRSRSTNAPPHTNRMLVVSIWMKSPRGFLLHTGGRRGGNRGPGEQKVDVGGTARAAQPHVLLNNPPHTHRPPFSGTLTTVPSSMRSSACCTPSPLTSRVMEMFSLRLVILSTCGMGTGGDPNLSERLEKERQQNAEGG